MRVLFLSAEAAPLTKVGGLGDVAGALPRALRALPEAPDVALVTPLHGGARARAGTLTDLGPLRVRVPDGTLIEGRALAGELRGVPLWLVAGGPIDEDGPVYHADAWKDGVRFGFFSRAALEIARMRGWEPDLVHAHDWHAAPAVIACHLDRQRGERAPKTVFTIHNLPFMGHGTNGALGYLGLLPHAEDVSLLPSGLRWLPLPIALVLADRVTTVSPGYAREILDHEAGHGLEGALRARLARDSASLRGILNGLDTELYDPRRDDAIVERFGSDDLDRRAANKLALQRELGLPEDLHAPLVALVSRLTYQKGIDLVPPSLVALARSVPFQLAMLGTGEPHLEEELGALCGRLPGRAALRVAFDEGLSRRIYAGADLLMLPSRYEPCGIAQLIGMRYGCVPVARDTGGLSDTVRDFDLHDDATGFLFPVASPESLTFGLRRALATFHRPVRFGVLRRNGMAEDWSWTRAARAYLELYRELVGRENEAT